MAYHTYKTEAFVLGGVPSGDTNRFIYLFTEALGVVGVLATGIKKGTSKLRFSLQDYSKTRVSLVYGKRGWRLINAENGENFYYSFEKERDKQIFIARLFSLVRRLIGGEERNSELFLLVSESLETLRENKIPVEHIEIVTLFRMLNNLGYVSSEPELVQYLHNSVTYQDIDHNKKALITAINKGLEAHEL